MLKSLIFSIITLLTFNCLAGEIILSPGQTSKINGTKVTCSGNGGITIISCQCEYVNACGANPNCSGTIREVSWLEAESLSQVRDMCYRMSHTNWYSVDNCRSKNI